MVLWEFFHLPNVRATSEILGGLEPENRSIVKHVGWFGGKDTSRKPRQSWGGRRCYALPSIVYCKPVKPFKVTTLIVMAMSTQIMCGMVEPNKSAIYGLFNFFWTNHTRQETCLFPRKRLVNYWLRNQSKLHPWLHLLKGLPKFYILLHSCKVESCHLSDCSWTILQNSIYYITDAGFQCTCRDWWRILPQTVYFSPSWSLTLRNLLCETLHSIAFQKCAFKLSVSIWNIPKLPYYRQWNARYSGTPLLLLNFSYTHVYTSLSLALLHALLSSIPL